jgi:hypothetical protein
MIQSQNNYINEHICFMKYACELYQQGYTHVLSGQFESLEQLHKDTKVLWEIFQASVDVKQSDALYEKNGMTVSVADMVRVFKKGREAIAQEQYCFYLLIKPGSDFEILDTIFATRPFAVNLI